MPAVPSYPDRRRSRLTLGLAPTTRQGREARRTARAEKKAQAEATKAALETLSTDDDPDNDDLMCKESTLSDSTDIEEETDKEVERDVHTAVTDLLALNQMQATNHGQEERIDSTVNLGDKAAAGNAEIQLAPYHTVRGQEAEPYYYSQPRQQKAELYGSTPQPWCYECSSQSAMCTCHQSPYHLGQNNPYWQPRFTQDQSRQPLPFYQDQGHHPLHFYPPHNTGLATSEVTPTTRTWTTNELVETAAPWTNHPKEEDSLTSPLFPDYDFLNYNQ